MNKRTIRYIAFFSILALLVVANVWVHMVSMRMSDEALVYEKKIATLKQTNVSLETRIAKTASLYAVASVAGAEGYVNGGSSIEWIVPVVASR